MLLWEVKGTFIIEKQENRPRVSKYQQAENLARLDEREKSIQAFKQCLGMLELGQDSVLIEIIKENIYELLGIEDIDGVSD